MLDKLIDHDSSFFHRFSYWERKHFGLSIITRTRVCTSNKPLCTSHSWKRRYHIAYITTDTVVIKCSVCSTKLCSIIRSTLLLVLWCREPVVRLRGYKYRSWVIHTRSLRSYNAESALCLEIWFRSVNSRMRFKVVTISLTFHPLHTSDHFWSHFIR